MTHIYHAKSFPEQLPPLPIYNVRIQKANAPHSRSSQQQAENRSCVTQGFTREASWPHDESSRGQAGYSLKPASSGSTIATEATARTDRAANHTVATPTRCQGRLPSGGPTLSDCSQELVQQVTRTVQSPNLATEKLMRPLQNLLLGGGGREVASAHASCAARLPPPDFRSPEGGTD